LPASCAVVRAGDLTMRGVWPQGRAPAVCKITVMSNYNKLFP